MITFRRKREDTKAVTRLRNFLPHATTLDPFNGVDVLLRLMYETTSSLLSLQNLWLPRHRPLPQRQRL
jgi:hypothetical protein